MLVKLKCVCQIEVCLLNCHRCIFLTEPVERCAVDRIKGRRRQVTQSSSGHMSLSSVTIIVLTSVTQDIFTSHLRLTGHCHRSLLSNRPLSQVTYIWQDIVTGHLYLTGYCHRSPVSDRILSQTHRSPLPFRTLSLVTSSTQDIRTVHLCQKDLYQTG